MNRIELWSAPFLVMLALAGCQDQERVSASPVECHDRLPTGEGEFASSSSSGGMSYADFQLGQPAQIIESRIARQKDWIGMSRADCSDVWFVRAGTILSKDGVAVCDPHGHSECELVLTGMRLGPARLHVLADLEHVKRFASGRSTNELVSQLKATYGEPLWERAARRTRGWPDLIEETSFIWIPHAENALATPLNTKFEQAAIKKVGAGDYLIATLIHNEDHKLTYAIRVQLRRVM